jgi:Terminase large subunit, T4likevirus-type, N-terminal
MVELREDIRLALDRVAFANEVGIIPDPWQAKLLSSNSKRVVLNCTRQSGKSTMAAVLALHRALYHPNSLVLCLAPALRQSQELFAKLGSFYGALGEPLRAYGERKLSLELTNGSRIVTLPGSERTVRGFSGASLLIVDEAARVDDDLYYAVRPMLAVSGGSLMMLSTPFGRRGIFYEEYANGTGWEKYEVTADQCPRISEEFLEEERKALGQWWFRQEYYCSFEEAEGAFFREEDLSRALTLKDLSAPPLFPEACSTGGGGGEGQCG